VTRGSRKLAAAKVENRRTMPTRSKPAGVMGGKVQRRPAGPQVMKTTVMPRQQPRQPGQGPVTQALRGLLRDMARADAKHIRDIEALTGAPIGRPPAGRGSRALGGGTSKPPTVSGKPGRVSDALRANLRALAQSDARYYREMGNLTAGGSKGQLKGGGGKSLPGSSGKGRGRKKKS
jgi:hypothetical protein